MGSLIFLQNGHRRTRFANTTPDSICIVAIDVGLCRSGRIGGAAGSLILSSKLFTSARFLPPRSGLMNLAVGFNPRLRVKYFPRRVATIEPTRTRARARARD